MALQLQLLSSVSSGIIHGEKDSPCDERLVSYSQCSYDEFLCKRDKF